MKCPYSGLELKLALCSIPNDLMAKLTPEVAEEINKYAKEPTAANIAEYHNIPVEALLASPNYNILLQQFLAKAAVETIEVFKNLGFTDKQAWAMIATALGSLEV